MAKIVSEPVSAPHSWTKPKMQRLKTGKAEFNIAVGPDAETETS